MWHNEHFFCDKANQLNNQPIRNWGEIINLINLLDKAIVSGITIRRISRYLLTSVKRPKETYS